MKDVPLGLCMHPLLQSTGMLLFKSTDVVVPENSLHHVHLAQDLVEIFNRRYEEIFPMPSAIIEPCGTRIRNLRQPDKRMSRSDVNLKHRIELTDHPDIILERIKKALTDFTSAVTYDVEKRPGVANLISIHSLCTGLSPTEICNQNRHLDTGQYKLVVAEVLVEHLKPIQGKIKELMSNPVLVETVLKKGSERAIEVASQTVAEVKHVVGLDARQRL